MNRKLRPLSAAALVLGALLIGCQARAEPKPAGYSAAGLYNLANAYARAGKPALAVLNYERAALLAPDDPDIEANLRHVRESAGVPAARSRFDRALNVASPRALYWLGVIGVSIVGAGMLVGRVHSRHRVMRGAGLIAGMALIALTAANAALIRPRLHAAVVIKGATPVRVSPVPMGEPLFALREAETVTMSGAHEGFVLIETGAGRTGWVARADLAPVVPPN